MSMNLGALPLSLSGSIACILGAATIPAAWAQTPFEEAVVYAELNDTDGDLGLHALIDGDEWKKLKIISPTAEVLLDLTVKRQLRQQGMTELFFESAEPSFDELDPDRFFRRFPQGNYIILGTTLDGETLRSKARLTHVMPSPAENILLSGTPAAEDCDIVPLPAITPPVVIDWDPVTQAHPEIGRSNADIEIVGYQVVVEREEPTLLIFSVDLPPDVTVVEVPEGFTDLGSEFKFEIVARERTGNQTAVESCFEIE